MLPVEKIPVIDGDIDSKDLTPAGKQLANALIMMNKVAIQVAKSRIQMKIEKPDYKARVDYIINKKEADGQPVDRKTFAELEEGRFDVITEEVENKTATIQVVYSTAMKNKDFQELVKNSIEEVMKITQMRVVNEKAMDFVDTTDKEFGN
jgi:hypothetical protein